MEISEVVGRRGRRSFETFLSIAIPMDYDAKQWIVKRIPNQIRGKKETKKNSENKYSFRSKASADFVRRDALLASVSGIVTVLKPKSLHLPKEMDY